MPVKKKQCIRITLGTEVFCALHSVLIFSITVFSFPKQVEKVVTSQSPI